MGGDVLRAMRRERILTPVIIVSGLPRQHLTEDIDSFGAVFLSKDDMTPETVRDAVATSLRMLGLNSVLAA